MGSFLQLLKNLGPVRLSAMAGVAIGLIAFFIFIIGRMATPQMALLYGDLQTQDAAQITQKLDSMQIHYNLRANGAQVWVPADEVLKLRMTLAQSGLPSGGAVGYEIFDKSEGLGTTTFQENVNMLRATEGELERSIDTLDMVKASRVHLVLPRRELFSRQEQEPSASIILKTKSSERLPREQVVAIEHLVASAVPKLKVSRISIIDDHGRLLSQPSDGSGGYMAETAEQMRLQYQNRLREKIQELLDRTLGPGAVRAEVTAVMDFDRVTSTSETYDPNGQVVRSTQTVNQKSAASDSSTDQPVTVASNLPDANANNSSATGSHQSSSRDEETTNYEISKTVQNKVHVGGSVKRLSVAVLVDGTYTTDAKGNQVYHPRTKQEMDQLAQLVRSAIGFEAKRGDVVDVINMRFADINRLLPPEQTQTIMGMDKADLFHLAEILVLTIVAILVILLVVRPLLSRAFEALPQAAEGGRKLLTDQSLGLAPALAAPAGGAPIPAPSTGMTRGGGPEVPDELIDIDRVEGRVKASSVKKIGEIVEKHPDEALAILRNWMYQEN